MVRAKKLNVKILKLTKESSKKIVAGIRPITNCHQLKQRVSKEPQNKRIEVESEVPNEELELLAQSQTLIKRFQDLALCTKIQVTLKK